MPSYESRSSYRAHRDVRDWTRLLSHIEHQVPAGVFWPIVGPRRSGKTWALKALEAKLPQTACYQQLSKLYADGGPGLDSLAETLTTECILLLDEPGFALFHPALGNAQRYVPDRPRDDISRFIQVLARLQARGHKIVMAMTPAEWRALVHADRGRGDVSTHDLEHTLKPLTDDQALAVAQDADARTFVAALPPRWARSPFLLTWLLHHAFVEGAKHDDVEAFLREFTQIVLSDRGIGYIERVFEEGLDAELRAALRAVGTTGSAHPADLLGVLRDAGLIMPAADGLHDIADPILAFHLAPPFRIHHISDLHFGPKSATMVDDKLGGPLGRTLGGAAGQRGAQDAYREHVESLPRHRRPHLILVSGDIAEVGGSDAREYDDAKAWLLRLMTLLHPHPRSRPNDPRIMLVGGNHDVDWKETRSAAGARKRHLPFTLAFAGIDGVAIARLDQPPGDTRPPTRHRFVDIEVEVVLLGSAEHGGEIDREIEKLTDTLRQQALAAGDRASEDEAIHLRKRYGQLDPGLVHHEDLRHVRSIELRGALGIAVLHHPVSPLPSSTELTPLGGGLLNAGNVKDALLHAGFQLVLHGHAHSAWIGSERWPGKHDGRTLHIVAAPTLSSYETVESHGYNELCIHLDDDGPRVSVTLLERKGDSFHAADHETVTFDARAPSP